MAGPGGERGLLPEEDSRDPATLQVAVGKEGYGLVGRQCSLQLPHHLGAAGGEDDLDPEIGAHSGEPVGDPAIGQVLGHCDHRHLHVDGDRGGHLPIPHMGQPVDHPPSFFPRPDYLLHAVHDRVRTKLIDPLASGPERLGVIPAVGLHHRSSRSNGLGLVTEDPSHVSLGHGASALGGGVPDPTPNSSQGPGSRGRKQADEPRAGAEGEVAGNLAHSNER